MTTSSRPINQLFLDAGIGFVVIDGGDSHGTIPISSLSSGVNLQVCVKKLLSDNTQHFAWKMAGSSQVASRESLPFRL
jgi:hypothetical protein